MAHVYPFDGATPIFGRDVFLAPTATVIGNATLGDESSVWFGAVVRADTLAIVLGARSNVQDNSVLHITSNKPLAERDVRGVEVGLRIGEDVTIGHTAVVHGCTIGDRVLVGIGAIVLDGAVIGNDVVIAAGALVTPGTVVPDGVMVMGRPAKVVRTLTEQDRFWSSKAAEHYVGYAKKFKSEIGV